MVRYAIGVDIGATNLRVALGNDKGKILLKKGERTLTSSKTSISTQILRIVKQVLDEAGKKALGIGIGSIGPIELRTMSIKNSPNIPHKIVPLSKIRQLGMPVYLYNDCLAAVMAENYFGAGKRTKNLVYVTLSTGIGGGAIVGGHLLLGEQGNAAEVGHFVVDTKYGLRCTCGKGNGHWEGLASGRNIPRFYDAWCKSRRIKNPAKYRESRQVFEAERTDKNVKKFLKELDKVNARAVSNIIVAYNPSLITFGGAVALNHGRRILKGIRKNVDNYLDLPKIKITPLGVDAVLLGGIAGVFRNEGGRDAAD